MNARQVIHKVWTVSGLDRYGAEFTLRDVPGTDERAACSNARVTLRQAYGIRAATNMKAFATGLAELTNNSAVPGAAHFNAHGMHSESP